MSNDKKRFILSLIVPIILLFVMYAVKIVEIGFNISLTYLGNYPISLKGLQGILLMPFIHGSWDHLLANTVPFFILCTALFYFYQKISDADPEIFNKKFIFNLLKSSGKYRNNGEKIAALVFFMCWVERFQPNFQSKA